MLNWNWRSRRSETGETNSYRSNLPSFAPPTSESEQAGGLDWTRFALSLVLSSALLLALVILPHPW